MFSARPRPSQMQKENKLTWLTGRQYEVELGPTDKLNYLPKHNRVGLLQRVFLWTQVSVSFTTNTLHVKHLHVVSLSEKKSLD